MRRIRTCLLVLAALLSFSTQLCGEEKDFPSPDGQFAFRLGGKSSDEAETFDLIDKRSGKKLLRIAGHDTDEGSSSRFDMEVLWRPDSKAFAVTETLWKRGSFVEVFRQEGGAFRKVKIPDLVAEPTEKMKEGRQFHHVAENNSQTATEWRKDGSLVVEIETMVDGKGGTLTVNRTVVLGLNRPGAARILQSRLKHNLDADLTADLQAAWDKGDFRAVIALSDRAIEQDPDDVAAYYNRGCANFIIRNWKKALSDFERHCDIRKADPNQIFPVRFYLWLIHARLGDRTAADKELAPYMEGHPPHWSNGWDAKTANFLLDRISETDFLAALNDNLTAAWFYAGMKRLLANDRLVAADDFKKSVSNGNKEHVEYHMAAAELQALSK